MMAVSVEDVGHGTFPENNCIREEHEFEVKEDPSRRQAGQGRPRETDTTRTAAASGLSSPSISSSTSPRTWTRAVEKRRRPLHDVDGPHTELLSCKKRRLRRDLITSRLSRPYSMPATHIIHREASATGDQRFMKLAAVARSKKLNAVVVPTPDDYGTRMPANAIPGCRQHPTQGPVVPLNQTGSHHMQASSDIVLRAAIFNRIRLKIRDERRGVGSPGVGIPSVVVTSDRSPMVGANRPLAAKSPAHPQHASTIHSSQERGTTATAGTTAVESRLDPTQPLPPRNTNPPATADILHLGRISPRLKPVRSPELRASRGLQITKPMDDDQLDDDSLSFPGNSVFDDDDEYDAAGGSCSGEEDIYADFSVIFGGGGDGDGAAVGGARVGDSDGGGGMSGTTMAGTNEQFEDYMDDLDGIPRAVR